MAMMMMEVGLCLPEFPVLCSALGGDALDGGFAFIVSFLHAVGYGGADLLLRV